MQKAQDLYHQIEETKNPKNQIELLLEALSSCYSAEIEANLFILQAEDSEDVMQQISYYKEALVAISKFVDKELIRQEQNRLNMILYGLYKPINIVTANEYKGKVQYEKSEMKESDSSVGYMLLLLFLLSLFYAFYPTLIQIYKK